ncbi:MAG: glycoside hydrolase family 16 protein [Longimicrobiales bacterium]|nr:glycoside hydrolase family 16 protein [Longimicrobiales bacterium]
MSRPSPSDLQGPLLLLAPLLLALSALPAAGQATGAGPGAVVVFEDGFDGPALDRSRWNVVGTDFWVNNEQQAYVDSSGVLRIVHGDSAAGAGGGALLIQAHPRPGFVTEKGTFDFVSGRVNTRGKAEFTYGTAAARMKLPPGQGLWPAFWILGTGDWPATGEIDVMEYVGETEWVSHALHGPGYSGDTPLVDRHAFPPGEDATGWHVYAVDWTPDSLVFRVDGEATYRVGRADVEPHGRWAFDNPKFLILNLALGGVYPRNVNGVEAPYPGLPAPTVDRIEAGGAVVLVDWVRVTRPPGSP